MKTEAWLFAGVAGFFLVTGVGYAWFSQEPAGTAALTVCFLMAGLIALFFTRKYRIGGYRPEDRKSGEVAERVGALDFFPPRSAYPPVTALGAAVAALGIVYGLWLFVIGLGILGAGVIGMVFEYAHRGE
ncbi:cytochrome c oxidase subunit 4 [Streptomyces sp. PSKA54]|uniref:cytochrome-c oxidase n=1 Tax=Streptomyces himalayensis subsp. aureolus TaxID=2758039 RepID=A0A7W2D1Y7_9ACTN|nr:cytochrome c oxidase subunit 4 [Streptomyces himalayensis]MBA4863141.1 cytochrome c oxidase subunit 4 [Streptomyces himalayensis subsp. aureolus]